MLSASAEPGVAPRLALEEIKLFLIQELLNLNMYLSLKVLKFQTQL